MIYTPFSLTGLLTRKKKVISAARWSTSYELVNSKGETGAAELKPAKYSEKETIIQDVFKIQDTTIIAADLM